MFKKLALANYLSFYVERIYDNPSSHSASELAGPHVIAAVRDYNELANSNFLETLDAVA